MWHLYGFFNTSLFIWYISIRLVKYLDKPIRCLEMKAKIKSVRKINEIFLCIFTYIYKSESLSTYLNFDKKCLFGYFQILITKCPSISRLLPQVLGLRMLPSQRYKAKLFYHSLWNTLYMEQNDQTFTGCKDNSQLDLLNKYFRYCYSWKFTNILANQG